ncbi:MAG: tetratricopeptide (TPR) repeat protein [bacterium]|jgi:tetratricopeptide (TPR) repeat protein
MTLQKKTWITYSIFFVLCGCFLVGYTLKERHWEYYQSDYQQIIKNKPSAWWSVYNLAQIHYSKKRYKKAKVLLQKIIDTKNIEKELVQYALFSMGNCEFQLALAEKKPTKRIQQYQRALTFYQDILPLWQNNKILLEKGIINFTLTKVKIAQIQQTRKKKVYSKKFQNLYKWAKTLEKQEVSILKELQYVEAKPLKLVKEIYIRTQLYQKKQNIQTEWKIIQDMLSYQKQKQSRPQQKSNSSKAIQI